MNLLFVPLSKRLRGNQFASDAQRRGAGQDVIEGGELIYPPEAINGTWGNGTFNARM